jgi:ADP-dependent phosphofructokinase/glucokinase
MFYGIIYTCLRSKRSRLSIIEACGEIAKVMDLEQIYVHTRYYKFRYKLKKSKIKLIPMEIAKEFQVRISL